MPPLPALRKKREAHITPTILQWFEKNFLDSCAIEIKATEKKSIPKSALQAHQLAALMEARNGTLVHKLSDIGRVRQPFDAFMLKGVSAFVVAAFTGKKERIALVIDAAKWEGATPDSRCAYKFSL